MKTSDPNSCFLFLFWKMPQKSLMESITFWDGNLTSLNKEKMVPEQLGGKVKYHICRCCLQGSSAYS